MVHNFVSVITRHWVSLVGAIIAIVALVMILLLIGLQLVGFDGGAYLGIITYMLLPMVFGFGLVLIPVGVWLRRKQEAAAAAHHEAPPRGLPILDLNNERTRGLLIVSVVVGMLSTVLIAGATVKGIKEMETVAFCGTVCHTVMEPEHTAYLDGPHARVRCVECHIGPGASWFVKAKVDGIRQVWAVTFNMYSTPIPSPVHDLRPARDTCEHCHWPDKFTGDVVRTFPGYNDDEQNSENPTTLQLRVGGGGWRRGGPNGIHWHTSANHKVEYIATDENRQEIPWVRLTDQTGKVTEFVREGVDPATYKGRDVRTMDCVDCHNRPSHRFAPSPERAVDSALFNGALPLDLPFVRREAVAALNATYPDPAAAEAGIRASIETFYATNHAALVSAKDPRIQRAVSGVQRIYAHNVFPLMKLTWAAHPNHLGHTDSPGCFRCHDEEHKSSDGRAVSQDCELCHKM